MVYTKLNKTLQRSYLRYRGQWWLAAGSLRLERLCLCDQVLWRQWRLTCSSGRLGAALACRGGRLSAALACSGGLWSGLELLSLPDKVEAWDRGLAGLDRLQLWQLGRQFPTCQRELSCQFGRNILHQGMATLRCGPMSLGGSRRNGLNSHKL